MLFFCFVFLRLVYPMLPVSGMSILIAPSVFSNVYLINVFVSILQVWPEMWQTDLFQTYQLHVISSIDLCHSGLSGVFSSSFLFVLLMFGIYFLIDLACLCLEGNCFYIIRPLGIIWLLVFNATFNIISIVYIIAVRFVGVVHKRKPLPFP